MVSAKKIEKSIGAQPWKKNYCFANYLTIVGGEFEVEIRVGRVVRTPEAGVAVEGFTISA